MLYAISRIINWLKMMKMTAPTRKIFNTMGENNGSFGMNNVPAIRKRNNVYFAGHASRLADGLHLAAIANMM